MANSCLQRHWFSGNVNWNRSFETTSASCKQREEGKSKDVDAQTGYGRVSSSRTPYSGSPFMFSLGEHTSLPLSGKFPLVYHNAKMCTKGVLMHVWMCSDQKAVLPSVLFQTVNMSCFLRKHKIRAKMCEILFVFLLLIFFFQLSWVSFEFTTTQ